MESFIKLYSNKKNEIKKFLSHFYSFNNGLIKKIDDSTLEYTIDYKNPVEMSEIIGTYIDNKDDYKINMWICIDKDVLINITNHNANDVIRYLYERFPY